jgi:photosystem II stability/assembly factor-like uncharacterized protein
MKCLLGAACIAALAAGARSADTDYALVTPGAATSLLLDIAAAGKRLVAVGERGHILYSDDGGTRWTQARVPSSVMLTRVFFISPERGWAVGHDGNILATVDGGLNWTLQRDGLSEQARLNEDRAGRASKVVREFEQKLAAADVVDRTALLAALHDAREELEAAREILNGEVYAPPLMDIWFADEEQGWASGAYGVLLRTSNGGRLWEDWSYRVDNPDELHFNGVTGDADGNLYLASEWGYVFRSASHGGVWHRVETGYDGSFFGIVVSPESGSVFAYGLLGTIYRSSDRGESWELLDTPLRNSLFGATADHSGRLVFVGLESAVLLTDSDGRAFSTLSLDSRRDLLGVASLPDGGLVAIGDGGSAVLASGPGTSH